MCEKFCFDTRLTPKSIEVCFVADVDLIVINHNIFHKLYTVLHYNPCMESKHLLSPQAYLWFSYRNPIYPKKINKSQHRIETSKLISKSFETFKIVLDSMTLPQEYKNEVFPSDTVSEFLSQLVQFNFKNPVVLENNKQDIAFKMISYGLSYFKGRYIQMNYIKSEISKFEELLRMITQMTSSQALEDERLKLYTTRKRQLVPPLIEDISDLVRAQCINCFNVSSGKTKKESLKSLRHDEYCSYVTSKYSDDFKIRTYIRYILPVKKINNS
jgi:hypothetical protein